MLVTSFYNVADTYFVGRLSTQSTAAVGIAFSVMALIQAVGFFFGHGSGNYISRRLGAKDERSATRMAATGFCISVACGAVIAAVGLAFLEPLCLALGSTPTILPHAEQYLGIVLIGAPFMTGSLVINNQLRFQGNTDAAMIGIVSGALLNVVLDPLLIFVIGLGLRGAALATLISQATGCIALYIMMRRRAVVKILLSSFRPTLSHLKEIVFGGTPSLARQGLASIAAIVLNHAAGIYGDAAIAGMAIVTRVSFFVYAVIVGLGQGFQPLCGFCYGAGLYQRVREGYFYCVRTGTIFITIVAAVCFVFATPIVHAFRDDAAVVAVGAAALRWQVAAYPFISAVVVTNMLLQTIRKPLRANLVASSRNGIFFLPLILLLPYFFGLTGVEMCQAVADVLSFALAVPLAWSAFRDMGVHRPARRRRQGRQIRLQTRSWKSRAGRRRGNP